MTATKPPDLAELNKMALEACDMWQEHLSTFAHDPDARAELTRFLEPQRRLFADWAALMQKGATHDAQPQTPPDSRPQAKPESPPPRRTTQPNPPPQRRRAALHMTATLSALLSLPSAWPNLKNASPGSNKTPLSASLARLGALSAAHPGLAPYLTREMALRARRFMDGVNRYRQHPARSTPSTGPVIWKVGTTTLRDYTPQASPGAPVAVAVPSLINRLGIFDLQPPDHSFLRLLAGQGMRVLALDWDAPGKTEQDFSLGDYVTQRLIPALQAVTVLQPAHVIGYCMGGLLALAAARLRPDMVRSLSLLATPWDFHAGYDALGQDGATLEQRLQPWLASGEALPVEVVQGVFTSFQPLHAYRKFTAFGALDPAGAEAERFVLTEDWLNDGVPLTHAAARECFGGWCARNLTARNEWRVGGQIIDPHLVQAPAYVVVPGRDRIVPPESAMPLARALPHAVRHEPMMGHIGIMAGTHAPQQVWQPLVKWLRDH